LSSESYFFAKKGDRVTVFTDSASTGWVIATQTITKAIGDGNLYYKLLNAVVNQELVDFAHIQTELNTKLSRSNKEEIVSWGMPDYTAGVAITTSTTNQTIESDGYLYLVGDSFALNRGDYFYINDIQFTFVYTTGATSYTETNSLFAPVLKGDRLRFSSPEHAKVTLYPLKGANQ
jgi:hypothetical protein